MLNTKGKRVYQYHDEERVIVLSYNEDAYARLEIDPAAPEKRAGMRVQASFIDKSVLDLTMKIW
jgi:hypothetical protein